MENKKLYNIYDKEYLSKKLHNEQQDRITCSFYKYTPIQNLEILRDNLYEKLISINVLGRIYIASEGINAQFSVPSHKWNHLIELFNSYDSFKNIHIKKAVKEGESFLKLKIMIKKEIVAWGLDAEEYDLNKTGVHLNAEEFNALIEKDDTILIDMRNNYESEVGKFENAICPTSKRSKDLIKETQKILKGKEKQNIAMYCTGGIRCEKASSHLIKQGFKNVFQLNGGIIEYANETKQKGIKSKFIGKNFVFDDRLGERITDDIIAKCHLCGNDSDSHTNCKNDACHLLFIICKQCDQKLMGCCSLECKEIYQLPIEEQRKIRKKFAKKFKNKFRPRV
tara:strand:+ start:3881 stop:4894 length:1014 start_codon:yes stop_codon:yes gene_type:complete